MTSRIAVIGGGWAGISAAVAATELGHRVTLFEMAPRLGGRARGVDHGDGLALDNGQHILIGAYRETLSLMRRVGVDSGALLQRQRLTLVGPTGDGLRLPAGAPVQAFARGVLACRSWSLTERVHLLATALRWRLNGFQANANVSVTELTRGLSERVRDSLIEPLCVAALNTPARQASAQVFLRVLRDAMFNGAGAADMLLPRVTLSALLPDPAARWLHAAGVDLRFSTRVGTLAARDSRWDIDGEGFDAVVLATTAKEAARLALPTSPNWAHQAAVLDYEPIVTIYVRSCGTRLPQAMTLLATNTDAPAQFVFDLGAVDGGGTRDGVFAFVVSGARAWIERGLEATAKATLQQAISSFPERTWREPPRLLRVLAERRATFLCSPALSRPAGMIATNLAGAGDYIDGPYPATLEGAVRSGLAASTALCR
jgi:squalene-associated FAD-dependent desaturase